MDIRRITQDYYVSPQISCEDMADIVAAGIKTVICNRPDNEVPPSHHAGTIEQAARAAGLEFHVLPMTQQSMTPDILAAHVAIATGSGPTLAYCASGTRSTVAWALGSAINGGDVDDILNAADQGGYALHGLRPTLLAASQAGPPAQSD